MKVRCFLCEHEKGGYCQKKRQATKPVKVKVNKARACDVYREDPLRVLADYRKREAHKKKLATLQEQRVKVAHAVEAVQTQLAARKSGRGEI